jgi:hypothetical protein
MMRRAFVLPLLLMTAAGCATPPWRADRSASPPARFAAALETSDPAVDAGIVRIDAFERRALREERAVGFALGGAPPSTVAPGPGAAEAAGDVIGPAFTALGDYAHVLLQAALRERLEPRPSAGPEALAQATARALPATRASLPPSVREAGLAGIAALASLAEQPAPRGRVAPAALARQADPHVVAVNTMLRGVIGATTEEATRGAIAAQRAALGASHGRMLAAARGDRSLGPAGRYALFHQLAALRDDDPAPGTLGAIVTLLDAMVAAHAAIAADGADAADKVATFESALGDLAALTGYDLGQD